MLTCCDMMGSNSVNHVCNRKKDKVVFCDTIMPSAGSAGAAELSHQYWSSSINSLQGKRRQALKATHSQNLCSQISVTQWMNSVESGTTVCLNN